MKKAEQENINTVIEVFLQAYMRDIMLVRCTKRLDYCTAWIGEDERFIVLQSYYSIVAVYDKKYNVFYDVLRYVYGYTTTSAKHISKLRHKLLCHEVLTWREV